MSAKSAEYNAEQNQRRAEKRQRGECSQCTEKAAPDRRMCPRHLREFSQRIYWQRKAAKEAAL